MGAERFFLIKLQSFFFQLSLHLAVNVEVFRFDLNTVVIIQLFEAETWRRFVWKQTILVFSQHEIYEIICLLSTQSAACSCSLPFPPGLHAGSLVWFHQDSFATPMKDVPSSHIRALDRLKDRTGLFILAGSAANKPSYETTHFGQGLLTYSLLLGIQSEALRDKQFIDVVKLFQFSADEVPILAKFVRGVQKPIILSSRGNSYDIGKIKDYERQHIVLKETRPIFVR